MATENPVPVLLSELNWNTNLGQWDGNVELFPSHSIQFSMVDENAWASTKLTDLLQIGNHFLEWAKSFEPQCRKRITLDLLNLYNRSWADEDPDEGPPPLTHNEFLAVLRISAISHHEAGSSWWLYSCGDLFAGHSIHLMLDADRSFIGKSSLYG